VKAVDWLDENDFYWQVEFWLLWLLSASTGVDRSSTLVPHSAARNS